MASSDDTNGTPDAGGPRRRGAGWRAHPKRAVEWFLIYGSRRTIGLLLLASVFSAFLLLNWLWPVQIQTLLNEETTVQGLLQTLLSGDILLVSIVVSVNALVVSQELTPIGDQHERVVESWNFREASEETIGDISPATPAEFLRQITAAIERDLEDLSTEEGASGAVADEEIEPVVESLQAHMRSVQGTLLSAEDGWFEPALFTPALDPSQEIDRVLQLHERSDELPEPTRTSISNILKSLQYFATAREYFKTIYYKQEFSRLSRDLIYTGVPTILLISYLLLAIRGDMFPGATLGVSNLVLFFGLAYTAALSPFLMLAGYVLRAALIAEKTVSAGGFIVE
jgi:hypothetical protein